MRTNADEGGVERLSISCHRPEFKAKPRHQISLSEINSSAPLSEELIPPHGVFIVKGWTRMVACYTILAAAYEVEDLLEVGVVSCLEIVTPSVTSLTQYFIDCVDCLTGTGA